MITTYKITHVDSVNGQTYTSEYTDYSRACKAMKSIANSGMAVTLEIISK